MNPNAVIPKQGTAGAAGFDLTAVSIEKNETIELSETERGAGGYGSTGK